MTDGERIKQVHDRVDSVIGMLDSSRRRLEGMADVARATADDADLLLSLERRLRAAVLRADGRVVREAAGELLDALDALADADSDPNRTRTARAGVALEVALGREGPALTPAQVTEALDAGAWVAFMSTPCADCGDWRATHGLTTGADLSVEVGWANGPCRNHERGLVPAGPGGADIEGTVRCPCPGFQEPTSL